MLLASGSALDLQAIQEHSLLQNCRFVLNDIDSDALLSAKEGLSHLENSCEYVMGNAFGIINTLAQHGPYDLVITGGLFDYLPNKAANLLVRSAFQKWLKPNGIFYFSNICTGNPYRYWMEYLENWFLVERDEKEINEMLATVTSDIQSVDIRREETGLTMLVVASKK